MCEVGRLFTFGSVIIARVLHLCYVSNHVTCVVHGFAFFLSFLRCIYSCGE